jgi:hypothetical protein
MATSTCPACGGSGWQRWSEGHGNVGEGPCDAPGCKDGRLFPQGDPVITPADLTDEMIREQRSLWLTGPATDTALTGVVDCNDALGRSHRRGRAREHVTDAINARGSR